MYFGRVKSNFYKGTYGNKTPGNKLLLEKNWVFNNDYFHSDFNVSGYFGS